MSEGERELEQLERRTVKPLIMAVGIVAMAADPVIAPELSENFIRYALTQGGLLSLVIVIGWSYRRDFTKMLDNKTEHISILTQLVAQSSVAQAQNAAALEANGKAIEAQAAAVASMTQVMAEFKGLLSGRRGAGARES
jgi:hypothetical protein